MPADLDYRLNEDGERVAAVVLAKRSAWHREGTVLPDHPTLEQAMELGGLDWPVEKVPHFIEVPLELPDSRTFYERKDSWGFARVGEPRYLLQSQDSWTVVRRDRWTILGSVGKDWQPLQNREAFGVLEPLLDDGLAVIETAGSIREGRQVWMLVRFDHEAIMKQSVKNSQYSHSLALMEAQAEEILPYGLFTGDHTGNARARVKETGIVVVCANTYDMASGRFGEGCSVEITHSGDVAANYRTAAQLLLSSIALRYLNLCETKEILDAEIPLSPMAFNRICLDRAAPIRHLEAKISRKEAKWQTEKALEKANARRLEISRLWDQGEGQTGSHSAWEALQAVTQWADHDPEATRTSSRIISLGHSGTLGRVKRTVMGDLLTYVEKDENEREEMLGVLASG